MNIPPKDFTSQEKLVAEVLSELGIRYAQQVEMGDRFTVDFFSEGIIIEVDGVYGHFRKADKNRDKELLKVYGVTDIFHIKGTTKKTIMAEIKELFGWNREDSEN